jgi:3-hydroxybutyryl-CoA dehydrogenase
MTNLILDDLIISFGHETKEKKKDLLRANPHSKIYMDLTCYDPNEFYSEFPQLKGSFAALFSDEEKKIEVHVLEKDPRFSNLVHQLGFKPKEISIISCGFVFPRTIVQIINEAYFALEEKVASTEDIDRAMKFGVNYPKGPFEWAKGKEIYVKTLLDELFQKTGDHRYKASKLLNNQAFT